MQSEHNSPAPFHSHSLSNPPNTICCQHTIPHSLPFTPFIQSPNTICCQHTIPTIPSIPTVYPIPLTQSAFNTQFPHSLPFPPFIQSPTKIRCQHTIPHPLSFPTFIQSPNTICCQHTIPTIPSIPNVYPIPLTQSAVNIQFPQSLLFPPFTQSP